jgi:hypothetical protein
MGKAIGERLLDPSPHARADPGLAPGHDLDLAMDEVAIALALEKSAIAGASRRRLAGTGADSPKGGKVAVDPRRQGALEDAPDGAGAGDVVPVDLAVESGADACGRLAIGLTVLPV